MDSIRSTMFATYNLCPYKYKLSKEIKADNIYIDIGTSTHKILELAPEIISSGGNFDELINNEIGQWKNCSPEMIDRFIKTVNVGIKNIEKTLSDGFEIKTETQLERKLPSGILITGKVDRIDTSNTIFRIVDYKTGSFVPTQQDMLGNFQLLVYLFLGQQLATMNQKIHIALFSLSRDFMQVVEIPFEIESIIEEVLDCRANKMLEDEKNDTFVATPSSACRYCEYQYRCGFWSSYKNEYQIPEDINEKIRLLESIMSYRKGLDGVFQQLKQEIEDYMVANEIESLEVAGKERHLIFNVKRNESGEPISISRPYIRVS